MSEDDLVSVDEGPSKDNKISLEASVNQSHNDDEVQDNDDEGGEEQESRDKIIRAWLES